jgi:Ser/Thr protein kinase RdoA (MazF antagonist)
MLETEIPASLVRIASQARDHWPIIASEPVLVMHRENTVFRVETTLGPAALRLHRPNYHSKAALQSELDWMAMLVKGGVKVPAPYAANDGAFLVNLSDEEGTSRLVDLLTWLDGKSLGRTTEPFANDTATMSAIFHNIGVTLARTHNLSDQWDRPKSFERPSWDLEGLVGDTPFWGRFWEIKGLNVEQTDLLARIRDRCRQDLVQLVAGGADFGLIHADLVRENILTADASVCFIDFDDSGFGFRMFDIATALLKNRQEPSYEQLKASLFEGYETARPFTQRDKQTLPLFLVLRSLTYLGWVEARCHEPGMDLRRKRMVADAIELSSAYLSSRIG